MRTILRVGLVVYTFVMVVGGMLLFIAAPGGWRWVVAGYVLANAVVILAGALFERGRYEQRDLPAEGWVQTGERFVDESSGKVMKVEYHPATGERRYGEMEK